MIVMRIKYKIIRIMQIYTCLLAYKADMHVQDKRTHICKQLTNELCTNVLQSLSSMVNSVTGKIPP